jgi:hypothetical protein
MDRDHAVELLLGGVGQRIVGGAQVGDKVSFCLRPEALRVMASGASWSHRRIAPRKVRTMNRRSKVRADSQQAALVTGTESWGSILIR